MSDDKSSGGLGDRTEERSAKVSARQTRDRELAAAIRTGDHRAARRVVNAWGDHVYDWARTHGLGTQDAEQVVVATFTAAGKVLRAGSTNELAVVIFRATRAQLAGSTARRASRRSANGPTAEDRLCRAVDLQAIAAEPEVASIMWDTADVLGERVRDLADLVYRHGLTAEEAGEVLGVPPDKAADLGKKLPTGFSNTARTRVLWRGGQPEDEELASALTEAEAAAYGPDAVRVINAHVKQSARSRARALMALPPIEVFGAIPVASLPDGDARDEAANALVGDEDETTVSPAAGAGAAAAAAAAGAGVAAAAAKGTEAKTADAKTGTDEAGSATTGTSDTGKAGKSDTSGKAGKAAVAGAAAAGVVAAGGAAAAATGKGADTGAGATDAAGSKAGGGGADETAGGDAGEAAATTADSTSEKAGDEKASDEKASDDTAADGKPGDGKAGTGKKVAAAAGAAGAGLLAAKAAKAVEAEDAKDAAEGGAGDAAGSKSKVPATVAATAATPALTGLGSGSDDKPKLRPGEEFLDGDEDAGRKWWIPAAAVAGVLLVVLVIVLATRGGDEEVNAGPPPSVFDPNGPRETTTTRSPGVAPTTASTASTTTSTTTPEETTTTVEETTTTTAALIGGGGATGGGATGGGGSGGGGSGGGGGGGGGGVTPTAPTTTIVPFQLTTSQLSASEYNPGRKPSVIVWNYAANKPMTVTVSVTGPGGFVFGPTTAPAGQFELCINPGPQGCNTPPGDYMAQARVRAADGTFDNTFRLPSPIRVNY